MSVVLLTADGIAGRIAANYLATRFSEFCVVVEKRTSRTRLAWRRARRHGAIKVFGQLAFVFFQRWQRRWARQRIEEILAAHSLSDGVPDCSMRATSSVNSEECERLLRELQPQVVLVVGTRLIDGRILGSIAAPFINYHAGITPKYRGGHGAYWALRRNDAEHCGATVHLIDEGIDTGAVLYQVLIQPTARDNFSTYPILQLAAALPLLERAAREAIAGTISPQQVDLPSHLWMHPTLWEYLSGGLYWGRW
jgi:folate-dependent phosphoribosylglycinamide formyltransferase PurN